MTANDSKSDLAYLNKLVSRWIVIIVLLIKNPADAHYSIWPKKLKQVLNPLNLSLVIESDNCKNKFSVLVEGLTYCINGSIDSPEKMFSINFSKPRTKVWVWCYWV